MEPRPARVSPVPTAKLEIDIRAEPQSNAGSENQSNVIKCFYVHHYVFSVDSMTACTAR